MPCRLLQKLLWLKESRELPFWWVIGCDPFCLTVVGRGSEVTPRGARVPASPQAVPELPDVGGVAASYLSCVVTDPTFHF